MISLIFISLIAKANVVINTRAQTDSNFTQRSFVGTNYTKYEYRIPMRDGVRLYTSVYVPNHATGTHPILLERTPYSAGPYGRTFREVPTEGWYKAGYIMAYQDVRGKYLSGGVFEDIRPELTKNSPPSAIDETTDTSDTIDFLVKNVPSNNGNVGLWGISYPGFYAEVGAIHTNEHLKAVSPQAPVSEWFKGDDWHHNGVFFLQDAFDFMSWFGTVQTAPTAIHSGLPPLPRGNGGAYDFFLNTGALPNFDAYYYQGRVPFWNEVLTHDTYDSWWQARSVPSKLVDVHCAMLFVGGFFDAEDMYGALHSYAAAKAQNPSTPIYLAMGPWFHGMWAYGSGSNFGGLSYGQPTSQWFRDNVQFPFFEKYLRGVSTPPISPVTVYNTGENKWLTFPEWPPKQDAQSSLYLADNKSVTAVIPRRDGSDSYVNDPAQPTPYISDLTSRERPTDYMDADQTYFTTRPDVLTYVSEPLTEDLTVAGPIRVSLWASTTGTDADFVTKLIDDYPADCGPDVPGGQPMANYELLVRGDIFRGKFRKSFSNPEAFQPGKPTLVPFEMNSVMHTFRKGHRIMIQIQSDWFPLCDRNPNVFEDINSAKNSDFRKATITIYHSEKYPSRVTFGVLIDSGSGHPPVTVSENRNSLKPQVH